MNALCWGGRSIFSSSRRASACAKAIRRISVFGIQAQLCGTLPLNLSCPSELSLRDVFTNAEWQ